MGALEERDPTGHRHLATSGTSLVLVGVMIIDPRGLLLLVVLAAVMVIGPAIAHLNGTTVETGGGPGLRMGGTGDIEAQALGDEATMLSRIISHVVAEIHPRCRSSLRTMWTGKSRRRHRARRSPDFVFL